MTSADLSASLKALDLGPSQDIEDLRVENVRNRAPKWKSKPGGSSQVVASSGESTGPITKLRSKPEVEGPIPPQAQKAELGALSPSPVSKKKNQWPRHRKRRSKEAKPQTSSSSPSEKQQEPIIADGASKECFKSTSIYVVEAALYTGAKAGDDREYEEIVGIYSLLPKANERAITYAKEFDISEAEITDIVSSFAGPKPTARTKATRRV
jgi:hypothetical protein